MYPTLSAYKTIDPCSRIYETTHSARAVRQKGGPMKKFDIIDMFEPANSGTKWTSIVEYELPYSLLGKLIDKRALRH